MRIVNRAHLPWFIFVVAATFFATWLYIGNFTSQTLPSALRLPDSLLQKPSEHHRVGGTPLGLIFGTIALSIFVFAALLGVRKKNCALAHRHGATLVARHHLAHAIDDSTGDFQQRLSSRR